ncbi:hypothetical protein HDU92_007091 [Lobulomyces angularis]|nr:hypothetical protein HDU92_007091 [Lobulomyces angularis]
MDSSSTSTTSTANPTPIPSANSTPTASLASSNNSSVNHLDNLANTNSIESFFKPSSPLTNECSNFLINLQQKDNKSDNEQQIDDQRKKSISVDSIDTANQKKRTRASPDQLAILEDTFLQNTSPNAKMREMLAEKLSMNERSIQIWFQNRRAKVKLLQKRAQSTNGATNQRMFQPNFAFPNQPPFNSQRSNSIDFNNYSGIRNGLSQKPPNGIISGSLLLSTDTLSIGTWRRVALTNDDLLCSVSLSESLIRWQIVESSNRFKLEFPISSIISISLETVDPTQLQGQLSVDLLQAPQFFMEVNNGQGIVWTQCRDFTEGHQATSIFQHVLTGPLNSLKTELLSLMNADQYFKHIIHINTPISSGSLNSVSSLKRPSLSSGSPIDELTAFNMQRRGSCPATIFDVNSPSFKLRRGSILDHPSPLTEATNLDFDSPIMGSPLNLPLTLSPSNPSMMFSPNLDAAFNQLHMLEDFNLDHNFNSPNSNFKNKQHQNFNNIQQHLVSNSNTVSNTTNCKNNEMNSNNNFNINLHSVNNNNNNNNFQGMLDVNIGLNNVSGNPQQVHPAQQDGQQTKKEVNADGTTSAGNGALPNTDFLFDIAQFLDSTSEMGFNDNLISV